MSSRCCWYHPGTQLTEQKGIAGVPSKSDRTQIFCSILTRTNFAELTFSSNRSKHRICLLFNLIRFLVAGRPSPTLRKTEMLRGYDENSSMFSPLSFCFVSCTFSAFRASCFFFKFPGYFGVGPKPLHANTSVQEYRIHRNITRASTCFKAEISRSEGDLQVRTM